MIGENDGLLVETRVIESLNGKKYGELNENLKRLVRFMFGLLNESEIIHCEKCDPTAKPDFVVSVKGRKHYVSMKTGTGRVVHNESLTTFFAFMRQYQIPEEAINNYSLFHFGDGTLDGSGKRRMTGRESIDFYADKIAQMNRLLNENEEFVHDFVMRVVFDGNNPLLPKAEFLYHGDENDGVICSKEQVEQRLDRAGYEWLRSPHIGMLLLHPYARYVNLLETTAKKRFYVTIEWPKMKEDIEYMMRKYPTKRDY